ncbi:MAG: hypothetical protein H5U06_09545 [Candidatus Aminicenantes bacterium]|nr:hypothetical protein [Candidatus Aminicenantes bacterium]
MCDQAKKLYFTKPFLLIVEGNDDKNFFEALINFLAKNQQPEIKNQFEVFKLDGKKRLTEKLMAVKNTPGFNNLKAIGIILDSNSHPERTLQSIQTSLKKVGFPSPKSEMEIIGEKPKISVLLIPGSDKPGELEDLCLEAISKDTAMKCVEVFFACLSDRRIVISKKKSKAICQVFLASRKDLAHEIGVAAQKSILPFEDPVFNKVKNFIMNLAGLPPQSC